MAQLRERKIHKEKVIKLLMNSGYGCFGNSYFYYQDPRVAELITAYGQYTLKRLENYVDNDKVLYGDTDSIYLVSKNDPISSEADRLGVELGIDKEWKILFLTPK